MPAAPRLVFPFHVQLPGIEPNIWRRIEGGKTPNFLSSNSVSEPEDQSFGREVFDESRVPLNALVYRPGQSIVYNYDFGDGWEHKIPLEGVLLAEARAFYPRCIAGQLAWPVRSGRLRSDGRQR